MKLFIPCLEVLAQLENTELVRPDVVIRVRTLDLIVACEFNFSGLQLHLIPKKNCSFHYINGSYCRNIFQR